MADRALEIPASRLGARLGPTAEPILLLDQDRSRWAAADRPRRGGAEARRRAACPARSYGLQARFAPATAGGEAEETDWVRIRRCMSPRRHRPGPIVELNRAVAVACLRPNRPPPPRTDRHRPRPSGYHLLPSVRGDLLARLGRDEEAAASSAAPPSSRQHPRARPPPPPRRRHRGGGSACRSHSPARGCACLDLEAEHAPVVEAAPELGRRSSRRFVPLQGAPLERRAALQAQGASARQTWRPTPPRRARLT